MFLVIAYPKLSSKDYQFIQEYRIKNDSLYYDVVEPHFTLVFPVDNLTEDEFTKEAESLLKDQSKFSFVLRSSVVNQDFSKDYYHEFLVPDEGFSDFIKLHDKLYSKNLRANLLLDVDFIPHIGIGNSKKSADCKKRVDRLNTQDFTIKGEIDSVSVVEYENNKITTVKEIMLN
jgi:hypothetical protein